jgi:TatD DNase family protein
MIADSHCHLDFPNLYNQLDDVVNRATLNNIKYLLTINTTLDSFEKIKMIIENYKNIYGTFGIHPHETKNNIKINSDFIKNSINKSKKLIGIGETGLDYYYDHSDRKIQKKIFLEHINSALDLNIPLIVHSRNAENDTLEILKSENKNSKLKILIHCFTGSKVFAKKLIDINCFISISGIVTFSNSVELQDAVSILPLDRLMVETDSPYLSPVPYRGKPNEPSYIIHTLKKISEIKNISNEAMMKHTTFNFKTLFNLP